MDSSNLCGNKKVNYKNLNGDRREREEKNNDSAYFNEKKQIYVQSSNSTEYSTCTKTNDEIPEDIDDYDKENWGNIENVSLYAKDIFCYLKERELLYPVSDYIEKQKYITRWMRSVLVDWMVKVLELFNLNHEVLYIGVKLVDIYLSKMTIYSKTLQLIGASAMFVASKYDDRVPPFVDDLLFLCGGTYTKRELKRMEIDLLKVCDFNLTIPISYTFLRRYAKCAKTTVPVLTLAKYILEYSLMIYDTITMRDSLMASVALFLALRMMNSGGWTTLLEFCTGYTLDDILPTVHLVNNRFHEGTTLKTIRKKYYEDIFYEVAKIPLIKNEDL